MNDEIANFLNNIMETANSKDCKIARCIKEKTSDVMTTIFESNDRDVNFFIEHIEAATAPYKYHDLYWRIYNIYAQYYASPDTTRAKRDRAIDALQNNLSKLIDAPEKKECIDYILTPVISAHLQPDLLQINDTDNIISLRSLAKVSCRHEKPSWDNAKRIKEIKFNEKRKYDSFIRNIEKTFFNIFKYTCKNNHIGWFLNIAYYNVIRDKISYIMPSEMCPKYEGITMSPQHTLMREYSVCHFIEQMINELDALKSNKLFFRHRKSISPESKKAMLICSFDELIESLLGTRNVNVCSAILNELIDDAENPIMSCDIANARRKFS